jgi:septum formation inhibitor-activating ATPase MinD
MKQLLILSGKGGTGKTTIASAFIRLSKAKPGEIGGLIGFTSELAEFTLPTGINMESKIVNAIIPAACFLIFFITLNLTFFRLY